MIRVDSSTPHGFRASSSGLLVPEALSREREVWTKDEAKLLERAAKLLQSRHLTLYFGCEDSRCKAEPIERRRHDGGGLILRCAHKDRVLERAF